jgi:NosR/NirI family nitrous oxide reductase transcriptional regulator
MAIHFESPPRYDALQQEFGRLPMLGRSAGTALWIAAVHVAAALVVFTALVSPALAEKGKLRERLTPDVMAVVYPGADRLGPEEGSPPAIAVYKDDKIVAYVFSTLDIIAAPGYSTTPFDVIGGVDVEGRITGAKVVFHAEPYIVHDVQRQRLLDTFLAREAGRPLRGEVPNALPPDFVAGASISTRAMRAAVLATARLVLRARAKKPAATATAQPAAPALDTDSFALISWDKLVEKGAVVRRRVTSGEVAAALAQAGAENAKLDEPLGKPDGLYIEVAAALFTLPAIGGNLVGMLKFEDYRSKLPDGAHAIFIASKGRYNFMGSKFILDPRHRFDRLRLTQEGQTFDFVQDQYQWINPYSKGIRGMEDAALFAMPARFDPAKPWRLELLVNGMSATPVMVAFELDYKVPDVDVLTSLDESRTERPPAPAAAPAAEPTQVAEATQTKESDLAVDNDPPPVPAWVEAWHDSRTNVIILTVLLTVLTLIFMFQAKLARYRLAHRLVRNAFLLVVLVWLGWNAGVQLSIVHVMNYARAPFLHLDVGIYLAEPLMVIVAAYTLISLLLIGRGVFCGWLCPFGAMQELLAQVSRALRVPQWNPSHALERRLWWGKYVAAAVVLILVMTEIDPSGATAEIEPFKTAIISRFTRAWPYVLYAGALLAIGLFSERAYCRFLCPLGGVLAALDRLHLLNLLKRRPECGNPCHLCERSCPVRAIVPSGKIITAECFQCLDCQVEYYDDQRCPPLVQAAKTPR